MLCINIGKIIFYGLKKLVSIISAIKHGKGHIMNYKMLTHNEYCYSVAYVEDYGVSMLTGWFKSLQEAIDKLIEIQKDGYYYIDFNKKMTDFTKVKILEKKCYVEVLKDNAVAYHQFGEYKEFD